jgi:hypothetical protein
MRFVLVSILLAASFLAMLSVRRCVTHSSHVANVQKLPTLNAELFYLSAKPIVRRGSDRILFIRFFGDVEFVPYHFETEKLGDPQIIENWRQYLNTPLVFNAGQFAENHSYLGWLKSDGQWINPQRKQPFLGLLVSGPQTGAPWAQVVDLQHTDSSVVNSYRNVVQSMMLFDQSDNIRVRDTSVAACRTVIAEDNQNQILLIVTEGAVTLSDLARFLLDADLNLIRAMNLDGGVESQLSLNVPEKQLTMYGQYSSSSMLESTGVKVALPVVIAVRPKR